MGERREGATWFESTSHNPSLASSSRSSSSERVRMVTCSRAAHHSATGTLPIPDQPVALSATAVSTLLHPHPHQPLQWHATSLMLSQSGQV